MSLPRSASEYGLEQRRAAHGRAARIVLLAGRSINARFNSEGTEASNRPPGSTYFSMDPTMPDHLRSL
ncbi:hypothetical protein NDU88_000906 [Pleurodeles waltl]|uniref:Uncharacterized protein n=1 Tax=Pleurodeles waltl TaxID=8319 RepID=A0AAV7TH26_PLEWA|nr:hypothetical protein NDU88_000906 [Pleurodeles waltl]